MAIVSTGATALSAVIGVLYKTIMRMHKDQKQMLQNQADIREQIGMLKGQQEGIGRLSADVIETIHICLGRHERKEDSAVKDFRNTVDLEELKRKIRENK